MSIISQLSLEQLVQEELSLEGKRVVEEGKYPVYVVLTDTNTIFSKVSKWVTGDPYNHVSLALDYRMDTLYTFALKTDDNGIRGGFKEEDSTILEGARYSQYRACVDKQSFKKIEDFVKDIGNRIDRTKYSHKSLINFLFNRELFSGKNAEDAQEMICSQFVVTVFKEAGIDLFKRKNANILKPYDLVRSKLLEFVRRGTFR